jgi:hypothetical protein
MRDKHPLQNINVNGYMIGYYKTFIHLRVQIDDYY